MGFGYPKGKPKFGLEHAEWEVSHIKKELERLPRIITKSEARQRGRCANSILKVWNEWGAIINRRQYD
uniref:Uncharacterized protein n=1 Tax=viral metagenome TaxID=1070528 RepID=A0A6M3L7X3_9ZZZZ